MGTGKTRGALWAWDYLYGNKYAGKLIIAAKLSTVERVWAAECFAALPHRKVVVLHGTKKRRLERLNDPEADIFIINHDGLGVLHDALVAHPEIDVLVIDELATYRNANARSKLMLKFAERMKFVWGMTGSPMPNEPTDVWMQCKIITPHTVPRYRTHARDMLMTKMGEYLWLPKPEAVERAYSWMQPAVRFTLDDVVELPEVITRYIDVPLGPQQQKVYKAVATEFMAMVGSHQINADNAAAAMNKLLQISGGYVYAGDKTIVLDADARQQVLVDLIEAATGKVLVFCPFRHMVTGLSKRLGSDPTDPEYIDHAVIHGDVSLGMRNTIFDAFQTTPQFKVILAHPGCMAHGLTLTAADTIIWYCPITSLELYEQANARIRRVGQKHRQQIFHLQATPVERKIYSLLTKKAKIQNMLLSLFADATNQAQEGQTQEKYDAKDDASSRPNLFSCGDGSPSGTAALSP
jgi:SNF2 family DNA or RNA helicase